MASREAETTRHHTFAPAGVPARINIGRKQSFHEPVAREAFKAARPLLRPPADLSQAHSREPCREPPSQPRPDLDKRPGESIFRYMAKHRTNALPELLAVTKALADEHRIRILMALRQRELCVCQIVELFGLAPSTISKHLEILRHAGLVEARKQGRWMHYRLPSPPPRPAGQAALRWLAEALEEDPQVLRDARCLQSILRIDPRQLCARQRRN